VYTQITQVWLGDTAICSFCFFWVPINNQPEKLQQVALFSGLPPCIYISQLSYLQMLYFIYFLNFHGIDTEPDYLVMIGIRWNSTFHNASHEACLHCIGESSFDTEKSN